MEYAPALRMLRSGSGQGRVCRSRRRQVLVTLVLARHHLASKAVLRSSPPLPLPQKYWADNIRPYKYVTAQAIRSTFWESEAAEGQRALLAAPPATEDLDDERSALTTHK